MTYEDSDTPRTTADAAKSCLVLTIVFVVIVFVVLGVLAWAMF